MLKTRETKSDMEGKLTNQTMGMVDEYDERVLLAHTIKY
uniref:Uncharacterized protein n=1 Tax=Rhizophora mucronata TaxID=61149 RepID=A0A2P2NQM0_RHIMU